MLLWSMGAMCNVSAPPVGMGLGASPTMQPNPVGVGLVVGETVEELGPRSCLGRQVVLDTGGEPVSAPPVKACSEDRKLVTA